MGRLHFDTAMTTRDYDKPPAVWASFALGAYRAYPAPQQSATRRCIQYIPSYAGRQP